MSKFFKGLFLSLLCGIASAATCYSTGGSMLMMGGFVVCVQPSTPPPCPQTSGGLTSPVTSPRLTGISPLMVFFDNTGVTSTAVTGNTTTFQDVQSTWDFGDTLGSGTGTWLFGSNANHNLKRYATGNIAAHLYVTEGTDTSYTAIVSSSDGVDQVSCSVTVQAFDPAGINGWPGAATTCVSSSGNFTSCPASATHVTLGTIATINASLTNKRVLYRCGETFTGEAGITGTKWSVGAYGGCENTQTNLPIFNDTGSTYHVNINTGAQDGRISDIDCESTGNTSAGCIQGNTFVPSELKQITLYNIISNGKVAIIFAQGTEMGYVQMDHRSGAQSITFFINANESNCVNGSSAFNCGGTPNYVNVNYTAVLGNHVNGVGVGPGGGIEAIRTSACRLCVYMDNTAENASSLGGVFKFHNGNTFGSLNTWIGSYAELTEIADNLFQGNSGGVLSDIAPQNGFAADEYLRNIVVERNIYKGPTNACCDLLLMFSGANLTLRDNMFYMSVNAGIYPQWGAGIGKRGSANSQVIQYNEAYNNTCYAPASTNSGRFCILFDTNAAFSTATANSFAMNNMFYITGTTAGAVTVDNTGVGNTVTNNTTTVTNNPQFINGSTTFGLTSDWKPLANFSGGISVPVKYDAALGPSFPYGVAWSPTWDLGAVHH